MAIHIKRDGGFWCRKDKGEYAFFYKKEHSVKLSFIIKKGNIFKNLCPDCEKKLVDYYQKNLIVI